MDVGDELDVAERRGGSDYRNCRRRASTGVRHAPPRLASVSASIHPHHSLPDAVY